MNTYVILTILIALSRSQSARIINGDLPPSSSETFFTLLAPQLYEITIIMTRYYHGGSEYSFLMHQMVINN